MELAMLLRAAWGLLVAFLIQNPEQTRKRSGNLTAPTSSNPSYRTVLEDDNQSETERRRNYSSLGPMIHRSAQRRAAVGHSLKNRPECASSTSMHHSGWADGRHRRFRRSTQSLEK